MVATVVRMPREKKPPTETVRLAKEMVRRINRVAAHEDKTVPDFLLELLTPLIESREAKMLVDLQREQGQVTSEKKSGGKK